MVHMWHVWHTLNRPDVSTFDSLAIPPAMKRSKGTHAYMKEGEKKERRRKEGRKGIMKEGRKGGK